MDVEKKSTHDQPGAREESDRPQAAFDPRITNLFRHCDLSDPLFKNMHQLAQTWPGREWAWRADSSASADSGLSAAELKSRLADLPRLDVALLLHDDPQLPPMPQVLEELRKITADERVSVEAIGEVILKDSGLSAFLLRLVNSPFYGFSSKVDTVSRAVGLIGIKPLYSLALGFVFSEIIARAPKNMPGLDGLWRHSVAVGIAAQTIWEIQESPADSERLFVAGLLHDVGKLVLMCTGGEYARILYGQAEEGAIIYDLEEKILGFSHAKVGGLLLKKWSMPAPLITAVHWHHNPYHAAHYKEPAVIHLADMLANGLGLGARSGSPVPALGRYSAAPYQLEAETLDRVAAVLFERLEDIHAMFKP